MEPEYLDEYKLFLKSRIRDIETLRANMGQANFIVMDTGHGQGFSSIGLAFATKSSKPSNIPSTQAALTDALEEGSLVPHQSVRAPRETVKAQSVCFSIRGFERSQPARERIWGQPDQDIEFEVVASKTINDLIGHLADSAYGPVVRRAPHYSK